MNEILSIPKDFFGNTIHIGDEVAFMQIGYRSIIKGKIESISNLTCIISHERTNVGSTKSKQFHNQVFLNKN